MRPFFTYYGGKYRIAPKYPRPRLKTIIEPFAGSAGYSVRYHNHQVFLYDALPEIVGTWEFLIKSPPEDILKLPTQVDDVRLLPICQEAKWLIGWWLNPGSSHPKNVRTSWAKRRPESSSYWGIQVRESIARSVDKIRHWKVQLLDYLMIPNQRATWFIDPPYQMSGKGYVHNLINYRLLGEWTQRREGQVIACGQKGDNWLPFQHFCFETSQNWKKSEEVIWSRYDRD